MIQTVPRYGADGRQLALRASRHAAVIADFCNKIGTKRTLARLFDHFIGAGEQIVRNCKAERLGSLEIDDQLELGRQYHR